MLLRRTKRIIDMKMHRDNTENPINQVVGVCQDFTTCPFYLKEIDSNTNRYHAHNNSDVIYLEMCNDGQCPVNKASGRRHMHDLVGHVISPKNEIEDARHAIKMEGIKTENEKTLEMLGLSHLKELTKYKEGDYEDMLRVWNIYIYSLSDLATKSSESPTKISTFASNISSSKDVLTTTYVCKPEMVIKQNVFLTEILKNNTENEELTKIYLPEMKIVLDNDWLKARSLESINKVFTTNKEEKNLEEDKKFETKNEVPWYCRHDW